MALVQLTISRTHTGGQTSDLLAGGATGLDFGVAVNGDYSPVQEIKIRHDGQAKIVGLSYYLQPYSGIYGGQFSPNSDYARLIELGDMYGNYGIHVDENYSGAPFGGSFFKIRSGNGDNYLNRRTIPSSAMYHYNSITQQTTLPSSPENGTVGRDDNSTESLQLGNRANLRFRIAIPPTESDGGIRQFDIVFAYVFTS